MIIVGIDPGAHGGIAVLDSEIGILETHGMPMDEDKCIDVCRLAKILGTYRIVSITNSSGLNIVIEQVHAMPFRKEGKSQGSTSTFKFGQTFGEIVAIGKINAHPLRPMQVAPGTWQKAGPGKTGGDKSITIEWVKKTYPEAQIIPKGCRVPHDGICDAIGIAHYGLLLLQGKIDPPKAKPIRRKKKK